MTKKIKKIPTLNEGDYALLHLAINCIEEATQHSEPVDEWATGVKLLRLKKLAKLKSKIISMELGLKCDD